MYSFFICQVIQKKIKVCSFFAILTVFSTPVICVSNWFVCFSIAASFHAYFPLAIFCIDIAASFCFFLFYTCIYFHFIQFINRKFRFNRTFYLLALSYFFFTFFIYWSYFISQYCACVAISFLGFETACNSSLKSLYSNVSINIF